jgi:hypothetical protein
VLYVCDSVTPSNAVIWRLGINHGMEWNGKCYFSENFRGDGHFLTDLQIGAALMYVHISCTQAYPCSLRFCTEFTRRLPRGTPTY